MALTSYGVNHPLAVKIWAKGILREALKETFIGNFIGTSKNSLIYRKDEASKGPGDRIRCGLRMQLTGKGTIGDKTLEGNEEKLTTHNDDLIIDQLRHAVRSEGKMSEQRVPFSVREEARDGLTDWWSDRWDTVFFNHICGYTAETDAEFTGANALNAPSSGRHLWTEVGTSADEGLDSTGDEMELTILDRALTVAKTATPLIRPIKYKGGSYYVVFLHPYQVYQLRTTTSTGQWLDIQKAAMSGGNVADNPIFTGALGMYNNMILHESTRVTEGVNSSTGASIANVRRAVLCGAQSVTMGFGREGSRPTNFDWKEELFDYGNSLGVAAGSIFGLKKARYNNADFGTVVMSSWSPDPSA